MCSLQSSCSISQESFALTDPNFVFAILKDSKRDKQKILIAHAAIVDQELLCTVKMQQLKHENALHCIGYGLGTRGATILGELPDVDDY